MDETTGNSRNSVNKLIRNDVLKSQRPIKETAMVRNIRFVLSAALFWNFIVNLFLVGLFSYLEIAIVRYNKSTLFAILETICLSIYIVVFYGVKLYVFLSLDKRQKEKIYDHRLIENIKDQATIDYCLPIPTIIILVLIWTYQIKIGGVDNGFNTIVGIFYTMLCIVRFAMAILSVFVIVTCSFSYYRPYIPPSKTKFVSNDAWVPEKYFHISETPTKAQGKVVKVEYRQ